MPSSNKVRKVTSENYPTDSGREGELIFRLVYQQAGCKKPFSRLWLSSMEENAIREGFAHLKPSTEYDALYNAALCRERADWMVGINASRLFSCLYGQPLAVGRVMTPVLAMTVVREAAIAAFVPEKFYTVDLELTSGCTASSRRIPEKSVAENLLKACRKEMVATIQRITRKEKSENPPPLYDLTTLQRDANRLLGYSAQQTLDYVQSLYEKKLTTYPRTDSCYITDDDEEMLEELTEELEVFLGITPEDMDEAVPRTRRTVNREKVTDHHAILPTRSMLQADLDALPKGEQNVLKLIIARTLMAVSKPFRYLETLLTTECAGEKFTAKGKEVLEEGWKAVERKVLADILNRKQELTALPNAAENECGILNAELKEGQTSPPKHFTEDTLLHAMETASADSMPEGVERQGIGTPATRAATIEKLVQKGFLERKGTKKTKVLLPTDKGKALITVMPEEIQSPEMTADWETKLLQIERGEMEPGEFMTEINTMITELVKNTEMKKGVNRPDVRDIERQHKNRVCDSEKRERPAFEGRTLLPHPQGTSFDLSHRIRTRSHHPGVTSLHSLLPLGTLMVSAAEVTYSSGCKDRRKHYGSRASARKKRLLLHRSELQGRSRKAKDQVGSHRSVRQEEQEESRGSFAGTSAELHGFHRTCGDSLRR